VKKNVPALRLLEAPDTAPGKPELPEELAAVLGDIAGVAREGLLALSVAAGMAVMQAMFEQEITEAVGPKGRHDAARTAVRHGRERGSVTLGGRKVEVTRPRARTLEGAEVALAAYQEFAAEDQLTAVVMEKMLAGVATRRQARTLEPVGLAVSGAAKSTSRSAVSRRFVRETETALDDLLAAPLASLGIKVLMIDGVHMADHCMVVALGIGADGTKTPLGLWEGATENKAVVTALLADLVERGLSAEGGLLAVVDGGKALAAGLKAVFGNTVVIQRCQIHKRRNVIEHLPEAERAWVGRKLDAILADANPDRGEQAARDLAKALERKHPGAAASLREGLPELFTVARLGITGTLARTLISSNPIESMFSIARRVNRNVTRWRDGMMVMRWTAAGMKQAATQFRRVKGHKQMPALITALEETTRTEHADKPVKQLRAA
jgi:transposase-like protein